MYVHTVSNFNSKVGYGDTDVKLFWGRDDAVKYFLQSHRYEKVEELDYTDFLKHLVNEDRNNRGLPKFEVIVNTDPNKFPNLSMNCYDQETGINYKLTVYPNGYRRVLSLLTFKDSETVCLEEITFSDVKENDPANKEKPIFFSQ